MSDVAHTYPPRSFKAVTTEAPWLRWALIGMVLAVLMVLLFAPLITVFSEALSQGPGASLASLSNPESLDAIRLTLLVAAFAVPLNADFGIAAAWLITKYSFRGKAILITLIDIPFSVSPVVAGLCIVLTFGANSWAGS